RLNEVTWILFCASVAVAAKNKLITKSNFIDNHFVTFLFVIACFSVSSVYPLRRRLLYKKA
ncbi:hypothetical protein, partial [Bacteroides cellulosilyticus]|uniref:hypothetical protein n=1 Tax=Bacteroides cellulosilyticus TaxID=246787 RepID=UPI0032EF31F1